MSIPSYIDSKVKLDNPVLWLTTRKFNGRDKDQHSYLYLEYAKKDKKALGVDVYHHVIEMLDFSAMAKEPENRVVYSKRVANNVVTGKQNDPLLSLKENTEKRIHFVITNEQKKKWKEKLQRTDLPVDEQNACFTESDISDSYRAAANDFADLAREMGLKIEQKGTKKRLELPNLPKLLSNYLGLSNRVGFEDTEWDEIQDRVVLVHAVNQDNSFLHGIATAERLGYSTQDIYEPSALEIKILASILGILTPDGVIGNHLDFEKQQFQGELIDRPHLHWCWNMLVEPNLGGNWEESTIAILEPLRSFESENNGGLFGIAPYDTLTIGRHQLSEGAIVVVPSSVFEKIRSYLVYFRGRIIPYDETKHPLRKVVTRVLKKFYPYAWQMCDGAGRAISNEGLRSDNGFRNMTCMRTEKGSILRLIQGENDACVKGLQQKDQKRFLGLHIHSHTYVIENGSNNYFATLKAFKNNHQVVLKNPLFAANVSTKEELEGLGSLTVVRLYQSLLEYEPQTRADQLADYLVSEAIYADIFSFFIKDRHYSTTRLMRMDFKLFIQNSLPELLDLLQKINQCISEKADEEARGYFESYCRTIVNGMENLNHSRSKVDSLIFHNGDKKIEEWLRKSSIFMGFFDDEFERIPVIMPPCILTIPCPEGLPSELERLSDNDVLGVLHENWPFNPKFQEYLQNVLQFIPDDLILLSRMHFLLHYFSSENAAAFPSHFRRYQCDAETILRSRILKFIIEFAIQEKVFLKPEQLGFSPFFALCKEEDIGEHQENYEHSIFLKYLCDPVVYFRDFQKFREEIEIYLSSTDENSHSSFDLIFQPRKKHDSENEEESTSSCEQVVPDSTEISELYEPTFDPQELLLYSMIKRHRAGENPLLPFTNLAGGGARNVFGLNLQYLYVEVQRYQFSALLDKNHLFKLFKYIEEKKEEAAVDFFSRNRSFFCSNDFIQHFVPIIAFQNHISYIQFLSQQGVCINSCCYEGLPLVNKTVSYGLMESFTALIDSTDFQITSYDRNGLTILHTIILANNLPALVLLHNHPQFESVVNCKDNKGCTALQLAVERGHFALFDYLVALDITDLAAIEPTSHHTLLHSLISAKATGRLVNFVSIALERRVLEEIVNLENQSEDSILFLTEEEAHLKLLISIGIDLTRKQKDSDKTLLYYFAKENKYELVKLFCKYLRENHSASFFTVLNHAVISNEVIRSTKKNRRKTALMIAAEKNNDRIVSVLIESGADVFKRVDGCYALDYAPNIRFREQSYNKIFRACYGNIKRDLSEREKILALHFCCHNQLYGAAKFLISNKIVNQPVQDKQDSNGDGYLLIVLKATSFTWQQKNALVDLFNGAFCANVNQADSKGCTPLMLAAASHSGTTASLLKYPQIDVTMRDIGGNTALYYSVNGSQLASLRLLLEFDKTGELININDKNNSGKTPFHFVRDPQVMKVLLDNGAIPGIRDNRGRTPLQRAQRSNDLALVSALKRAELFYKQNSNPPISRRIEFDVSSEGNTGRGLFSTLKSIVTAPFVQAPDIPWHEKVLTRLSEVISAQEIIDLLSEDVKLCEYFRKSAGVVEGYTVAEHTKMVLELAIRYKNYFEPKIAKCLEWGDFLLFLALHDIGKGVSKETVSNLSAKELELKTTQTILTSVLEKLWVRSHIGFIFQALLMYDSQGDYLKGDLDEACFRTHLLDMSAICGLRPHSFYKIYAIFHLVDAASYPNLKPLFVFGEESLQHCEGNQSLIDNVYESLKSQQN